MKSLLLRSRVEATKPPTFTCAPRPNRMPLGLIRYTCPLAVMRPKMADGSLPTTRLMEVLVAEGGRAVTRALKLGLRTLSDVEVLSGLRDDELVLLDPTLAPGARVRAHRTETPTAARKTADTGETFGNAVSQGFSR